jgi:hypothetical protein
VACGDWNLQHPGFGIWCIGYDLFCLISGFYCLLSAIQHHDWVIPLACANRNKNSGHRFCTNSLPRVWVGYYRQIYTQLLMKSVVSHGSLSTSLCDGRWCSDTGNSFLLSSSSLANQGGWLSCLFFNTYLLTTNNQVPRWNHILTQLRFIHNEVIRGIQWMVCWWVLVHCGCCKLIFSLNYSDPQFCCRDLRCL